MAGRVAHRRGGSSKTRRGERTALAYDTHARVAVLPILAYSLKAAYNSLSVSLILPKSILMNGKTGRMRPKAVQFGAGNIGRGFIGQLFFESGYETVFVDVDAHLVDELSRRGSYPIRIVGDAPRDIDVHGVRAVNGADTDSVVQEISTADIAATAVGVKALPAVAEPLARGLESRFQRADRPPLDIIVCENMVNAAEFLKGKVREKLSSTDKELLETRVGFVDASIGRMVPLMTAEQREEDPLLVLVEEYCELPVDKAAFKGPIPPIHHLEPHDNFQAYVERKLWFVLPFTISWSLPNACTFRSPPVCTRPLPSSVRRSALKGPSFMAPGPSGGTGGAALLVYARPPSARPWPR